MTFGIASMDGAIVALEQARVSALDRGFLYGDAVFEALRSYRGKPDALDAHLSRLERSCGILGIEPGVSRAELAREVERAIEAFAELARTCEPTATSAPEASQEAAAGGRARECYVRIMVTRGELPEALAPFSPPRAGPARRVILVRALDLSSQARYRRGIRVVSRTAPPSPLWAGAKPTAYLNNLLALGEAQREGAEDALLLGAYGELLEGATSSVFLVREGVIYTPPLALGILPGITRDRVLACAHASGIEARERLLFIHDAYAADELFLTSSVRLIVPAVAVDGLRVGTGDPGPITQRITTAYNTEVERL